MIKRACLEGKELLRVHKQLEGRDEAAQAVTSSSFLRCVTRAANSSILSLLGFHHKGYLSSSTAKKFQQFAEWAAKFLERVESGCSLRSTMISDNHVVRRFFEWRTLGDLTTKGAFAVWATRSEDQGVEASLLYMYDDPKMTKKFISLELVLRLSESTDIIGTAIKCLQPLVSQFKFAAEFAMGELSQQASASGNLQELSPRSENTVVPVKKRFADRSRFRRIDPTCCWSNDHRPSCGNTASSQLSKICPEEVSFFCFKFHLLFEKKYSLRRSSDEARRSDMLPLKAEVGFYPHFEFPDFIGAGEVEGTNFS